MCVLVVCRPAGVSGGRPQRRRLAACRAAGAWRGGWLSVVPCVRWPAKKRRWQTRKKGGPLGGPPLFLWCGRRCPTLPHPGGCSTIGAGSLSFRVRKGRSGRVPAAMTAATRSRAATPRPAGGCGVRVSHSGRESPSPQRMEREEKCVGLVGPLVPVGFTPLRGVHVRSINPVVFGGPSHREGGGELVLKRASRLDAFSGYPSRT